MGSHNTVLRFKGLQEAPILRNVLRSQRMLVAGQRTLRRQIPTPFVGLGVLGLWEVQSFGMGLGLGLD